MPRAWSAVLAVVFACSLSACATRGGAGEPIASGSVHPARVLLYLAPAPEETPSFLPAFRGAEVALAVASLDGEPATITWIEIPTDADGWRPPPADGAIVAPGTSPDVVARIASLLAVPTVSLAGGPTDEAWRSFAADDVAIAAAMATSSAANERHASSVGPPARLTVGTASSDAIRATTSGDVPGATIAPSAGGGRQPSASVGISIQVIVAGSPSRDATASATSAPRNAGRKDGVSSGAGAR